MSHTYSKLLFHAVFSTKERRPTIHEDWRERLYRYIAGIIKNLDGHLIRAGGVADHIHLFFELDPSSAISDVMRVVKANSSKWVHESFPDAKLFAWQTGYSAFTVSTSKSDVLVRYIDGQVEHHRKESLQDEVRKLLKRHRIAYDEAHLWD